MNYVVYRLAGKELVKSTCLYLVISSIVAYLFYDSIYAFIILISFLPVFLKEIGKRLCRERIITLENQFVEMIGCISSSLSAGLSVENAFIESRKDMAKMFSDKSFIVLELDEMIKGLKVNIPLMVSLADFGKRTGSDDINDFVTVFCEASKSGGNLIEIIKNTVSMMQDKKHTEDEISAMLKGKLLEQKVVCIIPFLIFAYLRISSREFIGVLYHNLVGIVVMSVCLAIYVTSIFISEKIVNIKV